MSAHAAMVAMQAPVLEWRDAAVFLAPTAPLTNDDDGASTMANPKFALTQAELKRLLDYDSSTGVFRWRERTSNRIRVGDVAGTVHPRGNVTIGLLGNHYHAHWLAWFYTTGAWPSGGIDHRDGDPSNNRIGNLRIATQAENMRNAARPRTNRSGAKGVSWSAGKWRATIRINGRQTHLGRFTRIEDAAAAYANAAKEHFGEFARTE